MTIAKPDYYSFNQLQQIREAQVFTKNYFIKAKYGKVLGLAKKPLDIAKKSDRFNEVYGMFQVFIDEKQAEILKEIKILVAKKAGNVELNDQVAEINCANPLPN
ncbi:16343_t:CDS:1 [Funneliformis mosseae]|uniref:16343_t:CDS:1 n=1 Tax=Funneliformis mosseae TaxID=27381 RepID=A0A9N9N760_FUNMO|nr:16343_t:CDS:1 [Funneliformis mosseae]